MKNTISDVMDYIKEEDVKFIRLAFCDAKGKIRNASVMPGELENAFKYGVSFDASAVGFGKIEQSDLFPRHSYRVTLETFSRQGYKAFLRRRISRRHAV